MKRYTSSRVGFLFVMTIATCVVFLFGLWKNSDIMFVFLLITFLWLGYYCLKDLKRKSSLLAFGIAFFVFFIGRELLEIYFGVSPDSNFPDKVNHHLYLSLELSLISVWLAYHITIFAYKSESKDSKCIERYNTTLLQRICLFLFYLSVPFVVLVNLYIALYVKTFGYYTYYTDFSAVLQANPLLYAVSKMEIVMDVSFCTFMATFPPKVKFKLPFIFYLMVLVISLGTGQRSTLILGLMLLFVFFAYMNNLFPAEKWMSKKHVYIFLLVLPVLAILGSFINLKRFSGDIKDFSPRQAFVDFFYDQGVTSYVVKRAYELEDQIPKDQIYTLEFLYSGLPARLLGNKVIHGNSEEHAMHGNSFTHSLGYVVLGKSYLRGAGTGSSYIAELFFDFGYAGVILGSMLYGWLLSLFYKSTKTNNVLVRALSLIVLTRIIWACRASFSGFLSYLFSPITIFVLLFIFGVEMLYRNKRVFPEGTIH